MTGREWINAMSDVVLAVFISKLMSQHRVEMIKALRRKGLIPTNVEFMIKAHR